MRVLVVTFSKAIVGHFSEYCENYYHEISLTVLNNSLSWSQFVQPWLCVVRRGGGVDMRQGPLWGSSAGGHVYFASCVCFECVKWGARRLSPRCTGTRELMCMSIVIKDSWNIAIVKIITSSVSIRLLVLVFVKQLSEDLRLGRSRM